jgi:hypothetical protein
MRELAVSMIIPDRDRSVGDHRAARPRRAAAGLVGRRPPGLEPPAAGRRARPWRDAVRRHGLSAAEAARLAREVPRGYEFDDLRLRRAAADWAGTLLAQELPRPRTAVGRVMVALLWLWALGVTGLLLHRLLLGRPEDVNWVSVAMYALLAAWIVRRRRGLRRTVSLNSAAPTEPDRRAE